MEQLNTGIPDESDQSLRPQRRVSLPLPTQLRSVDMSTGETASTPETYAPVRYVPSGTESDLTVTSVDGLVVYRGPTPQSSGWLVSALKRVDDAKMDKV
ncbi:hypothetical protein LRC484719_20960 [Mycobacterium riyadhense]